jgi:uncharacterized protein involved in propanediol utilization
MNSGYRTPATRPPFQPRIAGRTTQLAAILPPIMVYLNRTYLKLSSFLTQFIEIEEPATSTVFEQVVALDKALSSGR